MKNNKKKNESNPLVLSDAQKKLIKKSLGKKSLETILGGGYVPPKTGMDDPLN